MNVQLRLLFPRGGVVEAMVLFWFLFTTGIIACAPVQTLKEILHTVDNEDSLLRADLESIIEFTPNSWGTHIITDNEVPAKFDPAARDPLLSEILDDQDETEQGNTSTTSEPGHKREVDPWSLVWYMASFGGLVTFFLVVSCSECCCSKKITQPNTSNVRSVEPPPEVTQWVDETPPPPYHLFAPPSYDTLFYGSVNEDKKKCDIYVVPVHQPITSLQSVTSDTPSEPTL